LVLERRHVLGGAAVTEEIYPGFKYSVCSYVVSLMRPHIIRELELSKHGLEIIPLDCAFTPFPDGRSLARWGDWEKTRREIEVFSRRDAEVYPEFAQAVSQLGRFVKPIIEMTPPDPTSMSPSHLVKLLKLGNHFREFSGDDRVRILKLMTMSAVDLLDMWFESDQLKSPMSVSGIIGTFLGVRSPGTAYVLLHHYMGEIDGSYRAWGFCKGGMGAVSNSLASSARSHGAEIICEAPIARVRIKSGRATGVVLENGDEHNAKVVISSLDPHRTFLKMVGPEHLDDDFLLMIKRFKMRGSSGKVNLAVDRVPNFSSRPGAGPHIKGDIAICPSIEYLEKAYDDAKYGRFSRRPFINMVIPSLSDPSLAPPGKHVVSCFVQYAPYHLAEGPDDWPNQREAFGDVVVDTIEEYCPGFKSSILHRQVLTPWDLEKTFGLTEGNIFHGELGVEQLFFQRPVPGWARYKTPVKGLWLCGSGAHPGGGVMGAPGANAAAELLRTRAL
jgi:phytoene dehydrogenase-like protein